MPQLNPETKIQYMKGVGPKRAEGLETVGITTVRDLLYYLPRKYLDRTMITPIGKIKANTTVTIIGKVLGKGILKGGRHRLEVIIGDDTGYIALIWFNRPYFFEKLFNKNEVYAAVGPVTYFQQLQIVHPEMERIGDEDDQLVHAGRIVPVYRSTSELKTSYVSGKVMRRLVNEAVEQTRGKITDPVPVEFVKPLGLHDLNFALSQVHYPDSIENADTARKRLAFDELLELQYLILSYRKEKSSNPKSIAYKGPGKTYNGFLKSLPFSLTEDQKKSSLKIIDDMQKERPMNRLLQGDVGCGKTVVAVSAAVFAAENNLQTAFMAPTELLAEQHYHTWEKKLAEVGIKSGLLTGSMKAAEKKDTIERLQNGEIDILFGTHALLSDPVEFPRLGLVVIDEQHRFGVMQRGKLIAKGLNPDILVMTATPIPRTLALTLYGDLDITSIRSLPPGRKGTKTAWRAASARPEIYDYLKKEVKGGEQVFIIYPLVEKSDKLDLQAAEDEYSRLKAEVFSEFKIGLVHGQMPADKRDKTILKFRNRKLDILVSTTVIEVGIDIPSANIMIIEHAERFGLSQLHQLRGRVGRGGKKGLVVAVATPPLSEQARQRLALFTETDDGFKIAEADLELRGPGEFFGTRQHGLPELKIANLARDADLLEPARELVVRLLGKDKELDRGEAGLLSYLKMKSAERRKLAGFA